MCISLRTSNVEGPFMCLFPPVSLLWWNVFASLYLFKSLSFLNSVVWFCIIDLWEFLIYFEYKSLIKFLDFANIFSQYVPCHFFFLMVSFKEQMFLILMKSNSSIFFLILWIIWEIFAYTRSQRFSPFFFIVLSFRSVIYLELSFIFSEMYELNIFLLADV